MYYVYVLYSTSRDKFYIGYTSNLERRLKEHQAEKTLTVRRIKADQLVYYEACLGKKDAEKRERQLKTGYGRRYLRDRLEESIMPS